MKKTPIRNGIMVLTALLPAGYLALIWTAIPQTVPMHYGTDFKPDRLGDKDELWFITSLLALVSIGIYFLLENLHRIDPKRTGTSPSATFRKLAVGLVVFMAILNIIIIASAKGDIQLQNVLSPVLGLLFIFLGNNMNSIKPNYFAGIRLPWTLNSNENWRRTHQFAGKLWFASGTLIVVAGLLLPASSMWVVMIALLAVMVLLPVIYSYRLFRQQV